MNFIRVKIQADGYGCVHEKHVVQVDAEADGTPIAGTVDDQIQCQYCYEVRFPLMEKTQMIYLSDIAHEPLDEIDGWLQAYMLKNPLALMEPRAITWLAECTRGRKPILSEQTLHMLSKSVHTLEERVRLDEDVCTGNVKIVDYGPYLTEFKKLLDITRANMLPYKNLPEKVHD